MNKKADSPIESRQMANCDLSSQTRTRTPSTKISHNRDEKLYFLNSRKIIIRNKKIVNTLV